VAYPPTVIKMERMVLEIIARGHPDRTMNHRGNFSSGTVNAIEWNEIQVASGLSFDEFGQCIAHLVQGNLIKSGRELPGFLGRIAGKQERTYFWATDLGHDFLKKQTEDETPEEVIRNTSAKATPDDIDEAARIFKNSFSANPYEKPDDVQWAVTLLDDDIKSEIKRGALELEEMWTTFETMFGRRGPVQNEKEKSVRDPAVKRSVVRVCRAIDEQRKRKNFGPSEKPEAWQTHYRNGEVGLEPASWE
jgi:hypothetical protein